jgi:hypothetical protein
METDSGACSIEFFMASKDPFRVGPANKITIPWPFDRTRSPDEAHAIADAIRDDYEKVLRDSNITLHQASVERLAPKGSSQSRDTLVILALDLDSRKWMDAATLIQDLLDKEIRRRKSVLQISVEIRNNEKMYRDTSSALRPNTPAHQVFMALESKVEEQVKRLCAGQCTSISYHMRGPSNQTENRKPTIMVTIYERSRNLWETVETQLAESLDFSNPLNLAIYIELLPGHPQLLISKEMEKPPARTQWDLTEKPVHGSSIGARGAEMEAGSLGTWVYFQPPGQFTQRRKCFLTCYHVIAPGDTLNRAANDSNGIGLEGRNVGLSISVDYPAYFDAKPTKEKLRSHIDKGLDVTGRGAQALQIIEKYQVAGGIGSVIHASGYNRTNEKGHRMDWALVGLYSPTLFQKNRPPPKSALSKGALLDQPYWLGPNDVVTRIGTAVEGEWAAKIGRTTEVTTGEVTAMKSTVFWANGMETKEIQITNLIGGYPFVDSGDSGKLGVILRFYRDRIL